MKHFFKSPCLAAVLTFSALGSPSIWAGPLKSPVELCAKYLNREGKALPATPESRRRVAPFVALLRDIIKPPEVEQPFQNLQASGRVDARRGAELIAQLKDPESDLNREMEKHISDLGGMQNQRFWDNYFKSYDTMVGFTNGFLDLAVAIDEILPPAGVIADFGAGTGNYMTHLALREPDRRLIGIDFSPGGLAIAENKMKMISDRDHSFYKLYLSDLKVRILEPNSLDGAVMNNVLYTLGDDKLEILKNIFSALKPGAPFVLSDIVDVVKRDHSRLVSFLTAAAMEAINGNAPVTEYDLALVGKINTHVLMSPQNAFLTSQELKDFALAAGFEINGYYSAYYGAATFLYLRKPIR